MLGIREAEHEETSPKAPTLIITKLACSLVGKTQTITTKPESVAYQAYKRLEVTERFGCSYGLNPSFQEEIEGQTLKITGADSDGAARIVEMANHPFYLATLFLPQISSTSNRPHPLIIAYLRAVSAFKATKNEKQERGEAFTSRGR